MPEPKTLKPPKISLVVECPDCDENISIIDLEPGMTQEETAVEHDWCEGKFLIPAIKIKPSSQAPATPAV